MMVLARVVVVVVLVRRVLPTASVAIDRGPLRDPAAHVLPPLSDVAAVSGVGKGRGPVADPSRHEAAAMVTMMTVVASGVGRPRPVGRGGAHRARQRGNEVTMVVCNLAGRAEGSRAPACTSV